MAGKTGKGGQTGTQDVVAVILKRQTAVDLLNALIIALGIVVPKKGTGKGKKKKGGGGKKYDGGKKYGGGGKKTGGGGKKTGGGGKKVGGGKPTGSVKPRARR